MQKIVMASDRLNEESAVVVMEIVLDNMLKHNMVCAMEVSGMQVMNTDVNVVLTARELWGHVLTHTIINRVRDELVKRKLLPVTARTLCSLLLEAVNAIERV